MLLRFSKITLLLSAVGLLAACSSIANKSPDEMVRYGIQRTFMQDNQYNFTGEYRVKITPSAIDEAKTQADQTDQTPKETSTPTDKAEEKAAAVSAENNTQKQHKNKQTKQSNNHLKRHKTSVSHQPSTEAESDEAQQEKTDEPIISFRTQKFIADHVTVPYTGAVDLRHGRIELIPEIRYQTRNALVNMKFPMQVSIPDRAFMIDPAAVAPWSDADAKSDAVIEDKYLLLQLPHDVSQKLPLKQLIYAIPKAIDDGVATIDKQAFTQVPLDDAGRRVGAHYRVQLNITNMQNAQMTLAILKSLSEQLKRDEALDKQNPQTKTANYASIQDILQIIDQLLSAYMKQDDQTTHVLTQQQVVVDFYLDRRGRIVAYRQIVDLDVGLLAELLGHHNKMKVVSWLQLDYTSHPKFTLDPHSKNVIDLYQRYLDHKPIPLIDDAANTDESEV